MGGPLPGAEPWAAGDRADPLPDGAPPHAYDRRRARRVAPPPRAAIVAAPLSEPPARWGSGAARGGWGTGGSGARGGWGTSGAATASTASAPPPASEPPPAAPAATAPAPQSASVLPQQAPIAAAPDAGPDAAPGPDPQFQKQEVAWSGGEAPGTVVVDTGKHFLFLVEPNGKALRYGVGVGRDGFEWTGVKTVTRKAEWPEWIPPDDMLKRRPDLPTRLPGGPHNPLGARALYLGSTLYRIHGTNDPSTIGQNVSSGCIRMTNDDVIDLYNRVPVGTKVIVM